MLIVSDFGEKFIRFSSSKYLQEFHISKAKSKIYQPKQKTKKNKLHFEIDVRQTGFVASHPYRNGICKYHINLEYCKIVPAESLK